MISCITFSNILNPLILFKLKVIKTKELCKTLLIPELGIEPRSGACEAPVLTVIRFGRSHRAQINTYTLAIVTLSIAFLH